MSWSDAIDWDRYLRAKNVTIRNADGGRGAELGVRTFDCPLCGDEHGRGWLNADRGTAGCFNAGCEAEPRLQGGAITWARRAFESVPSDREVYDLLRYRFARTNAPTGVRPRPAAVAAYEDWCQWPPVASYLMARSDAASRVIRPFLKFAERQWHLSYADLVRAGAAFAVSGRHRQRVLFPVTDPWSRQVIGFQGRTIIAGQTPKYRTSEYGPRKSRNAECGRPAAAMVYVAAPATPEPSILLVEGIADAIAAQRRIGHHGLAVALMGVALTTEKLALLAALAPRRIVVALDADARERSVVYAHRLVEWGFETRIGRWVGGKDAASGARLVTETASRSTLEALVAMHLKGVG